MITEKTKLIALSNELNQGIRSYYEKVIKDSTEKLCVSLEIPLPTKFSPLILAFGRQGSGAQTKIMDDGSKGIILRPYLRLDNSGVHDFKDQRIIHEVVHTLEKSFLGLPNSKELETSLDTHIFLHEGFAEFLSRDNENCYDNLKNELLSEFKVKLEPFTYLENFFCTSLESEHYDETKEYAPYIVGAAFVKFIIETKDLKKLKELMLQTLVNTKYGVGWNLPGNKPLREDFQKEEERIRDLFFNFITANYGNISSFEKLWRKKFT